MLVEKPFALFVANDDKDRFYLCRKQVLRSGVRDRCDLKIVRRDGVGFFAELLIDPVLDAEVEVCLFSVPRELLDNAVKHAQAGKVWVSIGTKHGRIRITVKDDGVGFESAEVKEKDAEAGHFGLFSIREQLESLGGQFTVESKPGRGTTAMVVV